MGGKGTENFRPFQHAMSLKRPSRMANPTFQVFLSQVAFRP
jgi:hypothetical protein